MDHSWRLTNARCTFDTGRLRPGVLFTAIRGHDAGQFGDRSFEAVEREYARFLVPVKWFIDAREADGVSGGVLKQWTRWLGARPPCLARLDVLISTRSMAVSIALTQHLADIGDTVRIHESAVSFEAALWGAGVSMTDRADRPASASIVCERPRSGGFDVRTPDLHYSFQRSGAQTIHTVVSGREEGQMGDAAQDAFAALIDKATRPTTWELDLRGVSYVLPSRARAWSAWILAREDRFSSITVLAAAPAVAMFLLDTQFRLQRPDRMRIVRSPMP